MQAKGVRFCFDLLQQNYTLYPILPHDLTHIALRDRFRRISVVCNAVCSEYGNDVTVRISAINTNPYCRYEPNDRTFVNKGKVRCEVSMMYRRCMSECDFRVMIELVGRIETRLRTRTRPLLSLNTRVIANRNWTDPSLLRHLHRASRRSLTRSPGCRVRHSKRSDFMDVSGWCIKRLRLEFSQRLSFCLWFLFKKIHGYTSL